MSKIKNVIKTLIKKIILLLPNGNEMLATAILFRNRLYFTPQNANVEVQTPANTLLIGRDCLQIIMALVNYSIGIPISETC